MIYLKDGNIPLNLAYDDDIVQEANSTYQLSFKFPLTDGKWNLLRREVFLLADDLHGEQEFFIFEVKKANSYVQVYAKQVATLLNYYSINSISVDRVPGQTVMTALAGSIKRNCPFTFFSDIMDRHTFNESNVSVMDALAKDKHSIVGQWGGDLVRDKYQVKLLKNGGIENESLFMYKKNLSSYEESENINNLKTRLHLTKTIQGQSEGEADRVIAVTVDSPLIGQYRQIYEADIEVNDQDVTDEASLLAYGQRYFGSTLCDLVENSINLDVKGKSDVSVKMFDTVSVFHERFDVDLRLKITSYHFAPMSKRLKSIGFGKVSQTFGSTVASMVAGSVDKATGRLSASFEQKLQKEIDNANRHFDAEFDKRVEEINDGIEQSKAEAERYADQIKTEISQEFDTFEQEYQVTKQSQSQQIADILAKAQANTILATDAKNIGNQAKADAANALSKAIQYKNEAIAEATRLDTVERQATETKLATAKSQAISEATRLVETAKSLLSGQISNISTDLSQTKEDIKLLATKATVDTLTGRVSSAEAMIQVQADQISQRVKTSDFDQAKQRISTAESSITQLGNRITTEISETVAKIPQNVGSRNYIKNSKFLDYVITAVNTQDVRFWIVDDFWNNARRFKKNMVRVSFDISFSPALPSDISTNIHFSSSPWYNPGGITFKGGTTKPQHFDLLFDLSSASETYRTDNIFIRFGNTFPLSTNVKVEEMTLYLSELKELWTQATEDLINDISSVRTVITQTAEGQEQLSTRLTETQGKVTTAETNIRQLVNDVSSKVSQTTFDNLKRTVDSQGTSISQNQSAIALKAEKTYVDGVKTTADSALSKANSNADSIRTTKAELKVTSDAVATKVSQSDFNAVDQRLTSAETTIRTQAGLIEQRLTSTQVDAAIVGKGYQTASQVNTAITSKGYQTKADVDKNITDRGYITNSALQPYVTSTVFENKVRETTDSFSRSITETKALIPTDFSGGNLIRNGAFPTIPWSGSRVATHSFYYNSQKTLFLLETASTTNEATSGSSYFKVKRNTDYTLSFIAFSASRVKSSDVWFLGRKTGETQGFTSTNILISSRKFSPSFAEYITATFNSGENDEAYIRFDNNGSTDGQMAAMFFGEVMLVEGNTARKWEACFDDLVTETKYNKVKDTVDSHTRTIGEQGNSISQAIQTAQGLVTRVNNLKSGSRNYLLNSKLTTTDMTGISDTGSLDVPINISADCWKHDDVYKNQKIRLSLYYQSSVAYSTSRTFPVYFRKSPWYQIGTITYPANTVKLMKFEFTFGTMPTGFDATQIFIRFDRTLDRGRVHTIERAHLEVSDMFSDWSPAPEDGNQAIQAVSTQVNTLAGSWAVQNLNSSGDILSQANLSSAQFLLEAAKIRLKGKTLADEIQAIDGKFRTLFVADGTFAKLNANVIDSQAITADKLKVDQAFFTKFMANDAYLKQLFTKSAFITQVQAVTMSASQISGGILTATNGALKMDLNNGQISFLQDSASIRRASSRSASQFMRFEDSGLTTMPGSGIPAAHTILGSNYLGSESSGNAFAGLEIYSGKYESLSRVVGDRIEFRANQGNKNLDNGNWVMDFKNRGDSYFYPQKGANTINTFLGHMNSRITNVYVQDINLRGGHSLNELLHNLASIAGHIVLGGFSDDAYKAIKNTYNDLRTKGYG
ncbi:TPA: hypothetical protein VCA72_001612 [Streptococcus suis]|nr:hypothetical protein [Streptococcus suis]